MENNTNVMIKTNIGSIPLEDYLDIISQQHGFDNYDDMKANGYHIDIEKIIKNNKGE